MTSVVAASGPYVCLSPDDLKPSVQSRRITVFLCGPGERHPSYPTRTALAEYLKSLPSVSVTLGEDLLKSDNTRTRSTSKKELKDLQTIEGDFAARADCTILMLETEGAIAELGSFSMVPSVRSRLFVVVPVRYYGHSSYIARGPLSLLAKEHSQAVIYYDSQSIDNLRDKVGYPVMLHKYARGDYKYVHAMARRDAKGSLARVMKRIRKEFLARYTLATIAMLGEPHLAELALTTRLVGDELNASLKRLFKADAIKKEELRYSLKQGFAHELLDDFSSGSLSQKRCVIVATM